MSTFKKVKRVPKPHKVDNRMALLYKQDNPVMKGPNGMLAYLQTAGVNWTDIYGLYEHIYAFFKIKITGKAPSHLVFFQPSKNWQYSTATRKSTDCHNFYKELLEIQGLPADKNPWPKGHQQIVKSMYPKELPKPKKRGRPPKVKTIVVDESEAPSSITEQLSEPAGESANEAASDPASELTENSLEEEMDVQMEHMPMAHPSIQPIGPKSIAELTPPNSQHHSPVAFFENSHQLSDSSLHLENTSSQVPIDIEEYESTLAIAMEMLADLEESYPELYEEGMYCFGHSGYEVRFLFAKRMIAMNGTLDILAKKNLLDRHVQISLKYLRKVQSTAEN